MELLARAKEKANREATRLQAERKIPEWLKLEFAKFSLLTAWVDELFFLSNFEFRNNAVCEKGGVSGTLFVITRLRRQQAKEAT